MGIYRTTNPAEFDDLDGIIINEVQPSPSVQGVPANTVALLGQFERGPELELSEAIGGIGELHEIFGKDSSRSGNRELVNKRFGRLKIMRVVASDAALGTLALVDDDPETVLTVNSLYKGVYANGITVTVEAGSTAGRKYTFIDTNATAVIPAEVYDNVALTTATTQTDIDEIFGNSKLVSLVLNTGATDIEDPIISAAAPLASGSDGTIADSDYVAALGVMEQEGIANAIWSDQYSDAIRDELELHSDATRERMVIIAGNDPEEDDTAAKAEVVDYRDVDGRIIYAWNAVRTRINGILVWTGPASWIASIISNTSPHIDPAAASNIAYTLGATDVRHKISRAKYIQLLDAGIAGFERDTDYGGSGIKLKSGIVTQVAVPEKRTILRRRMTDFYTNSVAKFLKLYQNLPNTAANRALIEGAVTAWDDGLIRDGVLPADSEVRNGSARQIDAESLNTDDLIAAGQFRLLVRRRIFSSMRFIVLTADIGQSVVVTES